MTTENFSKQIRKADDACKELIIESLAGDNTYGFDIDSIYLFENENKWAVLEFLKCDHQTVRPKDSHPSRYWKKNWRKFVSLWRVVEKLDAEFYLVNYEDLTHAQSQGRTEREFHVIKVEALDANEQGGVTTQQEKTTDFSGFSKWFRKLNLRGRVV